MRTPSLVVALSLLLPTVAHAGRLVVGASLGLAQSKVDAQADANHTLGVFGRLGLTSRLAGQLELARVEGADPGANLRTATAALVLDLGGGAIVPILVVGAGIDNDGATYSDRTYHHVELGGGVEYRVEGGLRIGLDVRIGDRTLDSQPMYATPVAGGGAVYALPAPNALSEGEYRSARLTIGVAF
jgi:hypothetical protein